MFNPIEEWDYDEGYSISEQEFKVSNEDTERGVKLVADYLGLSMKEDPLQVVEDHKKRVPDIRKSTRDTNK